MYNAALVYIQMQMITQVHFGFSVLTVILFQSSYLLVQIPARLKGFLCRVGMVWFLLQSQKHILGLIWD